MRVLSKMMSTQHLKMWVIFSYFISIILDIPFTGPGIHSHPCIYFVWFFTNLHFLLDTSDAIQSDHPRHRSSAGISNKESQDWRTQWLQVLCCNYLLFMYHAFSSSCCHSLTESSKFVCWYMDISGLCSSVCFPWTYIYSEGKSYAEWFMR